MKNKNSGNKYSTLNRNVQLKIDEFFAEKIIPENDSVWLLEEIAEEIKGPLERAHKRTDCNYSTSPATILKVILYAAMENIESEGRFSRLTYISRILRIKQISLN